MLKLGRAPHNGALSLLSWLGVALVLGVVALSFFPQAQVVVVHAENNRVLAIPAARIDGFTYVFTHSVERTTVKDFYVVGADGVLVNTYTAQKSFGAGLPSAGAMDIYDGYFRFSVDVELQELSILVSAITEQRLEFGGTTLFLADFPDGTEITVSCLKLPLIWLRLKEVLKK